MQKSKVITVNVVLLANLANATPIPLGEFDGAMIFVPETADDLTLITWYASYDGSTYVPLNTSDNTPVTQAVADANAFHLHPSCNPAPWLKAVGNAAETIYVALKRMG